MADQWVVIVNVGVRIRSEPFDRYEDAEAAADEMRLAQRDHVKPPPITVERFDG